MRVDQAKVNEALARGCGGLSVVDRLALAQELVGGILERLETVDEPVLCKVEGLLEASAMAMETAGDLLGDMIEEDDDLPPAEAPTAEVSLAARGG